MEEKLRVVLHESIQWSEVGPEIVILDKHLGELMRLNSVAGFIWKQLAGGSNITTISSAVANEFEIDVEKATQDTQKFLKELINLELVEVEDYVKSN